jgi:hypothetical protein
MKTEDIIKYALLAVGGYLVWLYVIEPLMNPAPATAGTAPATGTTAGTGAGTTNGAGTTAGTTAGAGSGTPALPPATSPVAPTKGQTHAVNMAAVLASANTTGLTVLDADQWNFYWNQLGYPAVPNSVFTAAFFPNGRPANAANNPTMTAAQFVASLTANGMTGLTGLGDIMWAPQSTGMGNTGFRRRKVNGFGGNPGRVSAQTIH